MLCQPFFTGTYQGSAGTEQKKRRKEKKEKGETRKDKKKKKEKAGHSLKRHNESSALVLAVRGTLLTVSPVCQSRRTVLCVAEVLGHWIPCFSDSLLGTDPERCCLSLGSPTVTDIHLLFSCGGVKTGHYLTHFNGSLHRLNCHCTTALKAWWDDRRSHL